MILNCPYCNKPIEIVETEIGWEILKHGDNSIETSDLSDSFLFGELRKRGEDDEA